MTDTEGRRDETDLERWDRNFIELLQELRVAQTGVQILFAFLLTLPFTNRFGRISDLDKTVYVITLVAAATATALLIAPVSDHRQVFRQGRKPEPVRTTSALGARDGALTRHREAGGARERNLDHSGGNEPLYTGAYAHRR